MVLPTGTNEAGRKIRKVDTAAASKIWGTYGGVYQKIGTAAAARRTAPTEQTEQNRTKQNRGRTFALRRFSRLKSAPVTQGLSVVLVPLLMTTAAASVWVVGGRYYVVVLT
jgi:hypothetical protein